MPVESGTEIRGTLIARYAYDVAARRIVRRVYGAGPNSATTGYFRMIYRGGLVTAETDSAGGSLTLGYVWGMGADDLLAVHDYSSGHRYYAAKDQLGRVRALTRRDGVWTAALKYRSYGAVMSTAGTIPFRLRYRWIGREFDEETGFYYLRARYFDPASQRFTQEDPIGYAGGSNVYAYGDGNPTNGRDLNGLRTEVEPLGAGINPFTSGLLTGCFYRDCTAPWERGAAWAGFSRWDLLTLSQREYAGNIEFASDEEARAYYEFRKSIYESGDESLIDWLERTQRGSGARITFVNKADLSGIPGMAESCGPACSITLGSARGIIVHVAALGKAAGMGRVLPLAVAIGHEMGHLFPINMSLTSGYRRTDGSAFYVENVVRSAYGCQSRAWSHSVLPPC